jgi:tRNA wybutosine-synthesizing protein 3
LILFSVYLLLIPHSIQILHILASTIAETQLALTAATTAGFRESGISSLLDSKGHQTPPMVAVRSSGQAFDAVIGFVPGDSDQIVPMVSEEYLRTCLKLANNRFRENEQRKARFQDSFRKLTTSENQAISTTQDYKISDKKRRKAERQAEQHRLAGSRVHRQDIPADRGDSHGERLPEYDLQFLVNGDGGT